MPLRPGSARRRRRRRLVRSRPRGPSGRGARASSSPSAAELAPMTAARSASVQTRSCSAAKAWRTSSHQISESTMTPSRSKMTGPSRSGPPTRRRPTAGRLGRGAGLGRGRRAALAAARLDPASARATVRRGPALPGHRSRQTARGRTPAIASASASEPWRTCPSTWKVSSRWPPAVSMASSPNWTRFQRTSLADARGPSSGTLTRTLDLDQPGGGRHEDQVADGRVVTPDDPARRIGLGAERGDHGLDDGEDLGGERVAVRRPTAPLAQVHAPTSCRSGRVTRPGARG